MILAVTGHRPPKVGGYNIPNPVYLAVMQAMDEALMGLQPEAVITGMALGIDQWMAELCIMNDIPFIAAIPFDGFDSRWPTQSQTHFHRLLGRAAQRHIVSPGAPYDPRLMQVRNEWMVNRCDKLLAVFNGTTGGTANCVRAARRIGKEVVMANVHPEIWAMARILEADLEGRAQEARAAVEEGRRRHLENLQRMADEGREARARMARIHAQEEEQRQHPLRRRRQQQQEVTIEALFEPVPVQPSVTEDFAKMREELEQRMIAAAGIPRDLLDPRRAEREMIEKTREKLDEKEEQESLQPRRLIEV